MTGATLVLATLTLGVDYGWQPTEKGDLEYIIQIEPELVQSLLEGREISSEVFPDLKDVRRFRIRVGDAEVPREMPPAPASESADEPDADPDAGPRADSTDLPAYDSGPTPNNPETEASDGAPPAAAAGPTQGPAWPGKSPFPADTAAVESSPAAAPPDALQPDPGSRPMHKQAGYIQDSAEDDPAVRSPSDAMPGEKNSGPDGVPEPPGPEKRWWPLTAAIVALFTSLGGNAYLAWIAIDFRSRYQRLALRES